MNYQEKYNLVAQAILEASEENFNSSTIQLCIDGRSKLSDLTIQEIDSILDDLLSEDAIKEPSTTTTGNWPIGAPIPPNGKIEFQFDKGHGFASWCVAHTKRKNRKLTDLSPANFEKILDLILEIDDRFQIKQSSNLIVGNHVWLGEEKLPALWAAVDVNSNDYMRFRADAIQYLEDEGVISESQVRQTDYDEKAVVNLRIDINKFLKIKTLVEQLQSPKKMAPAEEKQKTIETKSIPSGQTIYEVKYTNAQEVLLNNFLLSKLDFNSENDNVFGFIFRNPNRIITLDELKQPAGGDLKKDIHKILENLGFKADLRKAFFRVSKNGVLFRNPVQKKDLEESGIDWLKFPK